MKSTIKLSATLLLLLFSFSINAQIDLRKKVKTQTVNRANKRTDQGINKGLDVVEGGIKSAFAKKDEAKQESEKTSAQDKSQTVNNNSNQSTTGSSGADVSPSLASYSKYDFVPGEKVIVYEDFSQDAIGDFPALWYTNGSGEVVTLNNFPGKWLMMREKSYYGFMFAEAMPENYTLEFDYIRQSCKLNSNYTQFSLVSVPKGKGAFDKLDYPGMLMEILHEADVNVTNFGTDPIEKINNRRNINVLKGNCGKIVKVSIWVQKQRMRIYFNEEKVFDVPRMLPKDKPVNAFRIFKRSPDKQDYISNVRVAVGAPDMRSKLLTEGKLVTYGILFDTGSDKVKSESYGTLKSIADVLKENADVKVKVIGHTDADGDAAKNLELSKRRAASVKNELVKSFGIDGSRIETDGKGKTEPIAPNDSPANKAQNRRVEFIKL